MDIEEERPNEVTGIVVALKRYKGEVVGKRGPSLFLKKKWKSTRQVIEFDSKNRIKDDVVRVEVETWQGIIAKTRVKLSEYPKWPVVPKEKKQDLWDHFLTRYDADPKYKTKCLQAIGSSWKSFKHHLTKRWIIPYKDYPDVLQYPPAKYDFIKVDDWRAFVRSRLSAKFQELSISQSMIRKINLYDHNLGRHGYTGQEKNLVIEQGASYEEDRSRSWLLARQKKNGEYLNEATKKIAENIEEVREKIKEGSLKVDGSNDVLTIAIGTPEHCGRVRGVGKHFTQKNYFHLPRRGSKAHIAKLEAENMQLRAKLAAQESMASGSQSPTENYGSNTAGSDNGKRGASVLGDQRSCGSTDKRSRLCPNTEAYENGNTNLDKLQGCSKTNETMTIPKPKVGNSQVQHCRLAYKLKHNIVAEASVFERSGPTETLHTVPLGDEYVKVCIVVAMQPDSPLYKPIVDECTTVGEAIGIPVAWPKEFVLYGTTNMDTNNNARKEKDRSTFEDEPYEEVDIDLDEFKELIEMVESTLIVDKVHPIDTEVFQHGVKLNLSKDEILKLCKFERLNVDSIVAYMRYLYEHYQTSRQNYGFCYPGDKRGTHLLIKERLMKLQGDQIIFVPYNPSPGQKGHWVLVMLDIKGKDIYYLDSFKGNRSPSLALKGL